MRAVRFAAVGYCLPGRFGIGSLGSPDGSALVREAHRAWQVTGRLDLEAVGGAVTRTAGHEMVHAEPGGPRHRVHRSWERQVASLVHYFRCFYLV